MNKNRRELIKSNISNENTIPKETQKKQKKKQSCFCGDNLEINQWHHLGWCLPNAIYTPPLLTKLKVTVTFLLTEMTNIPSISNFFYRIMLFYKMSISE